MEPVLIAAFEQMRKAHPKCNVDRILEHPDLRTEYLGLVRASAVESSEFEILHTLHNLRKARKLPPPARA